MAVSFHSRRQESAMHPVKAEATTSETTGFSGNIVAEADVKLRRGLRGFESEDPRAEVWPALKIEMVVRLGPLDFGAKRWIDDDEVLKGRRRSNLSPKPTAAANAITGLLAWLALCL